MPRPVPFPVAIAAGSNLGDRRGNILWALEALQFHLTDLRFAAIIETEPFEVPDEQPPYLNTVAVGQTGLAAEELLHVLLALERARGRTRPSTRAPRTLDLDLILYGDAVIETPELTVPHPRFRERAFVLGPLAEIAPEMSDPVSGRTMRELFADLTV